MDTAKPSVLIGTTETVRLLEAQLALLPLVPRPIGRVLLEAPASRPQTGAGARDPLESLAQLHGTHGFGLAIVSLPRSMPAEAARVRATLRALGIVERSVVPLTEALDGTPRPSPTPRAAAINTADLIGRTPHGIDRPLVLRAIEGRRVLITGAGGSIGSELVRIVATLKPERIILMERSENAIFEIDRHMAQRFPGVERKAVLHDVVDAEQTLRHMVDLRPQVVIHAAAHKHVPLMEDHPSHAVDNNFFGTKSIADAALAVHAERFVMISSDKAVNPSSVMGATKRLAEMYVQALHKQLRGTPGAPALCMVRFGNVLGSACSVLPIWSQQIADGGPVTVTDERMTRYFMTIHEAATLVIQAAAMSGPDRAAVYVLDMGEPIRILDLARRLVSAHGYEPLVRAAPTKNLVPTARHGDGPSLEITITGTRPGEKLHEELAYAAEQLRTTAHPGISAWAGAEGADQLPSPASLAADLSAVRARSDRTAVVQAIRRYVPTLPAADGEPVHPPVLARAA